MQLLQKWVGVLKVRHQDWPEQGFGYHDDKVVLPISFFYLWRKSVAVVNSHRQ